MRSARRNSFLHIGIILIFLMVIFLIPASISRQGTADALPIFNIYLGDTDPISIANGDKDIKYPNNVLSINNHSGVKRYDAVEIKGRGNSTWLQNKKPYQIIFNQKIDLFNMGAAKKWILLADYFDPTHLKNDLAFYLEKLLDQEYAINGQHVELYIDNTYQGLYYLTEKIEIGENRINLNSPLGIIVEHEGLHADTETCYYSLTDTCLIVKDSVSELNAQLAVESFLKHFISLETATMAKDYQTVTSLIDIDSFAKYYLLSNFTLNPDAFMSSYFFYQDGPDDKIHVGPGWDFDLAFSTNNQEVNYGINFLSPYNTNKHFLNETIVNQYFNTDGSSESAIIYNLLKIPEFQARISEIYSTTIKNHIEDIINHLDSQASFIRDCAILDNEMWELDDFDQSIANLKDWVLARYEYLNSYYDDTSQSRPSPIEL